MTTAQNSREIIKTLFLSSSLQLPSGIKIGNHPNDLMFTISAQLSKWGETFNYNIFIGLHNHLNTLIFACLLEYLTKHNIMSNNFPWNLMLVSQSVGHSTPI